MNNDEQRCEIIYLFAGCVESTYRLVSFETKRNNYVIIDTFQKGGMTMANNAAVTKNLNEKYSDLRYLFLRVKALVVVLDDVLVGLETNKENYENALVLSEMLTEEIEKFDAKHL